MKISTAFPLWNSNEDKQKEEWSAINWRTVKTFARRLENSIAKAVKHGDWDQVHKLRRIWDSSKLVKLLAVRGPTQDNKGKRTAGIDGMKVTTGKQRLKMASELKIDGQTTPLRRVWIPKPNGKKRPLGIIPTIKERCKMALVKGSIEPIYEQLAEPNSYGFRPARSCHDAIQAIFSSIKTKPKWVLEGDLKGFFDNINLDAILKSPVIINLDLKTKTQIKAWVEAGVVQEGTFEPTMKGTPQGGVISPLLANIAFMGLERMLEEWARTWKGNKRNNVWSLTLVVYADDFVVVHESREVIEEAKIRIAKWCKDRMGVELSEEKTKITHTMDGFDFLGFNVRQYKVTTNKQGFKTLIKPSKVKVVAHKEAIRKIFTRMKSAPQEALIGKLNPVIRGWANYYSHVVSKEIFESLDDYVWKKLWKWSIRRHPTKGKSWVKDKYFPRKLKE